ncbi:lysosomal acid phosphatase-like [Amphiura filiformis]|uniref:lysosomal acid phosphatase-like n=1 Tax=Amphiura filiformis TaxID=82378 RepID=UPI003B2197BE
MQNFSCIGTLTYAHLLASIFSVYVLFFASCNAERTLKLVHVLYRHGDRSPVVGYPNDPYKEDSWPEGFGQLTEHGMMQHYDLGQWLRRRYITDQHFLNETYVRTEIKVISTDYDRTIMSADSNLQGLYPRDKDLGKGMLWRPIPVFRLPEDCDLYLHDTTHHCPRFKQLTITNNQTKQKYIEDDKDFFKMVAEKAGLEFLNMRNITHLADTLHFEKLDGRLPPDWVTDDVMQRLINALHYWYIVDMNNQTVEYRKLFAGNLIKQIVGQLRNNTSGANNQTKLYMYSGHDSTVAALLCGFGLRVPGKPNTASIILIELYQEADSSYTVDVYFRNTTDLLQTMKLPECLEQVHCPLGQFYNLTEPLIPKDYKEECKAVLPMQGLEWGNKGWLMAFIAVVGCLLLALVMIALALFSSHRRKMLLRERRMEPINFHLLGHHASESEDESVFDT